MSRQYRDLAPPKNLSPEEYVKWYHGVMRKYGKNVFARYGIALPDEFEELSPVERDLLQEQVDELVYRLTMETKTQDEDTLAGIGFVTEEQWKTITEGKVEDVGVYFKLYRGRNYLMEFVRAIPDLLLHIFCSRVMYEYYPHVFDVLIDIMRPVTPTSWNVSLSFVETVTPFNEQRRGNHSKVTSSYCIKFENACNLPGAAEILSRIMNRILGNFILPAGM